MAITAAFNLTLGEVDWVAYLLYFFPLISVPTLIFIIGLAIFLMLVLKKSGIDICIAAGIYRLDGFLY